MADRDLQQRLEIACAIARDAGALALEGFRARPSEPSLNFKGPQDYLSATDAEVEGLIRARLSAAFPGDAFIGEGPERSALEGRIARLGLGGVVVLPGASADPIAALRLADLFVLPSREEGMSLALLEAMALGIPAVASAISLSLLSTPSSYASKRSGRSCASFSLPRRAKRPSSTRLRASIWRRSSG